MTQLKLFDTHDHIPDICRWYNIRNYTINFDGTIDVHTTVDLSYSTLKKLPLKFNKVYGDFICAITQLTTLEGCPKYVKGNFNCSNNELKSLEYCPEYVGGDFDCRHNLILSLKHLSKYIGGSLDCSKNYNIDSFEGVPNRINGRFDCSHNSISNFKFAPSIIDDCFLITHNRLISTKDIPTAKSIYGLLGNKFPFVDDNLPLVIKYQEEYMLWNSNYTLNEYNYKQLLNDIESGFIKE